MDCSKLPVPSFRRKIAAPVVCALLLSAFFAISWRASLNKCAAFDEPLHFVSAWIQTHSGDFRCNPEDPPLWKYYIAIGTRASDMTVDTHSFLWDQMLSDLPAPAFHLAAETMYQHHPPVDADALLRAARIRLLLLGVALGWTICWWAWRLAGPVAAIVAVAAFSFDPNFLAHSLLIKNDVAITLIFVLLMASVWLLGERVTLGRFIGVNLLVGIALTTKYSGLLAFPMLGIALFCRALIAKPWPFFKWPLSSAPLRFVAAAMVFFSTAVLGYFMIWASYGFRFNPSPGSSGEFDFRAAILNCAKSEMILRQDPVPAYPPTSQVQQWVNEWKPSPIVRAVKTANRSHLLPQAWLFGFLYTYGTALARRTFLCGDIGVAGWWYYFPAAMAFKTPLATLAGLGLVTVAWFVRVRRKIPSRDLWPICAVLTAPVFYMIVAMRSHLDIGLRHVFPVYPFLYIFLGVIAAQCFARRPKTTSCVALILFLGLICETLSAYPNYIPFFNVAAGGSRGGLALLSDSNLDWGQDVPALADWQRAHPDRQLYFCDFGIADPRYYGLHYIEMPGSQLAQPDQIIPSGLPPVYAISAVALQGPYMTPSQLAIYHKFLKEQPIDVLNGTIYLYDSLPMP